MSKEPTKLEFPAATPSPSIQASTPTSPSALVFPATSAPSKPADVEAAPVKALSFPECSTVKPPPPAQQKTDERPKALEFPAAHKAPAATTPATAAFQSAKHPLHETVMKAAAAFAPDTVRGQEERLSRIVGELLPLRIEAVENFGTHMLEQCRQHAEHTSKAIFNLTQLRVADTLSAIIQAINPPTSVVQKLKQKLTGASLQSHRDKLQVVRPMLADSLKELRAALPEAREDALRLTLHLLALRSTLTVVGQPTDTTLARACDLRLDTLRVAVAQASLVPQKMKSHEDTASLQMAEIDRLLAVTLSASAIAQASST